MGAVECTCLYLQSETLIPSLFIHIRGEILSLLKSMRVLLLISIKPQFWSLFVFCFSQGLERFLKKKIRQTTPQGSNPLQSLFIRQREEMFSFCGKTVLFTQCNNLYRVNLSAHQQVFFLTGFQKMGLVFFFIDLVTNLIMPTIHSSFSLFCKKESKAHMNCQHMKHQWNHFYNIAIICNYKMTV